MYYLAFLLGLTSSLHCVGMCGPIALALPVHRRSPGGKILGVTLYNLGRISVYASLGLIVGGIGYVAVLGEWQRWLSVAAGVTLLITAVSTFRGAKGLPQSQLLQKGISIVQNSLRSRLSNQGYGSLFVLGSLNGLLPCGMVYLALLSAVATSDSWSGAIYMAAFGAGTLPAMLTTAMMGQWVSLSWRTRFTRITPYLIAFAGVVLIFRGVSETYSHHHQPKTSIPICVGK